MRVRGESTDTKKEVEDCLHDIDYVAEVVIVDKGVVGTPTGQQERVKISCACNVRFPNG